jgi:hypothetical protein
MTAEQLFVMEGVSIAVKEAEAVISDQIRQGTIEGNDIPTVLITAEEIAAKKTVFLQKLLGEAKKEYDKEKAEFDAIVASIVPIQVHEVIVQPDTTTGFNIQADSEKAGEERLSSARSITSRVTNQVNSVNQLEVIPEQAPPQMSQKRPPTPKMKTEAQLEPKALKLVTADFCKNCIP